MSTVALLGTRPVGRSLTPASVTVAAAGALGRELRRIVVEAQSFHRASAPISVRPEERREAVSVAREPTLYWEDKGWQRQGQTYTGYFGGSGGRWPGSIVWGTRGLEACFVSDPPEGLWGHEHRRCFSHCGNGTYSVHFRPPPPRTVDAAIMTVERVLNEAAGVAS